MALTQEQRSDAHRSRRSGRRCNSVGQTQGRIESNSVTQLLERRCLFEIHLRNHLVNCRFMAACGHVGRRNLHFAPRAVQPSVRYRALVDQNRCRRRVHSGLAVVNDHDREHLGYRTTEVWTASGSGTIVPIFFESRLSGRRLLQNHDQWNVSSLERSILDRGRSQFSVNFRREQDNQCTCE